MSDVAELYDQLESLHVNLTMIKQDLELMQKENQHLKRMVDIMSEEPKLNEFIKNKKIKDRLKGDL